MKKKSRAIAVGIAALLMLAAASSSYVVKSGDTLSKIAQEHDTSVAALVDTNNIRDVLLFPHMRPEQQG